MMTKTLSWALLSGFALFGFAGPAAHAQSQNDAAQTSGPGVEQTSSAVGGAAEQTAQQSGRVANDASLATDLRAQLAEGVPGADDIRVDTGNGVVTLSGTVGSQAARQSAVSLASQMDGIRSVQDRLTVRPNP